MLPVILTALLLAPAATVANAASQGGIVARGDGIVRSPLRPITVPGPKLRIRQNEVEVLNQKTGTRYAMEMEIGTPPQTVTLIVDTGSPNTWVNPQCETYAIPSDCRRFPQFDYNNSSSLNVTEYVDFLQYGSGSAKIQYVYETVSIGCECVNGEVFAVWTA